jgi:hypothetical protein
MKFRLLMALRASAALDSRSADDEPSSSAEV